MFDATVESTSSVKLYAGIIVAIAIYFIAFHLPFGEFSADGKHAVSVFCVAAFLWITNVFPLAITGIIVLFLLRFRSLFGSFVEPKMMSKSLKIK